MDSASQNQPQAPAQVAPAQAPVRNTGSGFAIAALVLGIIAFIFGWLGFLNLITAILAIVFGIVALKKHQSKGMALTGLILGSVALIASLVFGLIGVAVLNNVQDAAKKSSTSSSQTGTSTDSSSKWDLQAAYDKVQTGMTKAEVEDATGKKSSSCISSETQSFGKTETCTYGNVFTDGGSITVTYDNAGTVSTKTKYEN